MSNRLIMAGVASAVGLTLTAGADAAIIFSNISATGTLSPATAITGSQDIDFAFDFPAGTVGDPVAPLRNGSVTIMFDGQSTTGGINTAVFSFLGAALGSGVVTINLTIEDLITPGTIASATGIGYNAANPPPTTATLNFTRATTRFHVMAVVTGAAPDTPAFDMAQLSLLEATFVPGPAGIVTILLGGAMLSRRRRS